MDLIQTMQQEMRAMLENNILSFWLDNMQDYEHGGFYGQMKGDGTLVPTANKGGILNARILWSFSAAYRVTGNTEYLTAATRAKDYILQYFIDQEYGGTYWELDYQGRPVDTKKQFYAIGFMIYGLSEYARATGDQEALETAIQLYQVIEEHSLDAQHNGYIEACTRTWGPIEDMRLSDLDANYPKSQNTHLHIIEPYTNLYRIWKSPQLEQSLRNLITIFTDKILNPETYHLDLFFEMDWRRAADRVESYGHDIECTLLLHQAALVLGDQQVLGRVEQIVQQVAKAAEKGLNADGSMVHEANLDTGVVDAHRHWWVQAEAVLGYLNIYQYFHDKSALDKSVACWKYIQHHLVDYTHGEWYWSCDAAGNINTVDDHAGFWKCPYHNSRMCLEIMEQQIPLI